MAFMFLEHPAFLGNEPLAALVVRLRLATPEKKIIVEITTITAAMEVTHAGFAVVQVENSLMPRLLCSLKGW